MEDELAFTLNLALYQEADTVDYITFMMNFWTVLNTLKPSEVIELQTVHAMNSIDLLMQVLPDNEPHDVPWFECFPYFEPSDLHSDYLEQEPVKACRRVLRLTGKGESCYPSRVDCNWQTQIVHFGEQGLDTVWSPNSI
ncbi:hypothetical protein TNCV_1050481 [Trichonephila clavipes]|nr:hypothetical protein TNCV_1050481 [Trichonephila clavipes]